MKVVGRTRRDERGAFLVLWALLIVAMLVMVGIVIDLGSYREERRDNRRAADSAAAAGTLDLASTAASRQLACQKAWDYAWRNLDQTPPSPSGCAGSAFTTPCTSATPEAFVTATQNGFTVTVTTPVSDTSPLMRAETSGADRTQDVVAADGGRCERLGVAIVENRETFFGGLIGQGTHSTDVHTVARRLSSTITIPASLVVLEPFRCTAFLQGGGATVLVEDNTVPPDRGGIVVISDGTASGGGGCSPTKPTIDGGGSGSIRVTAPGDIYLAALPSSSTSCTGNACDPGDVPSYISPQPAGLPTTAGIGRELVEYVFNCKENYTTSGADSNYQNVARRADGSGGTLPACDQAVADVEDRDYIDSLVDNATAALAVGDPSFTGIPLATIQTVPGPGNCVMPIVVNPGTQALDVQCRIPANATMALTAPNIRLRNVAGSGTTADVGNWTLAGNVFFDQRLDIGNGDVLTVTGNVVLNEGAQMSSGGTATFVAGAGSLNSCGSTADRWLGWVQVSSQLSCLRQHTTNAGWAMTRGPINMNGSGTFTSRKTAWYGSAAGQLNLNGNLTWTMPTDGPLDRLALWSDWDDDGSDSHTMTAGGSMVFEGVFFSPVAEFRIRGSFPATPQSAQFITQTFDIGGSGTFRMAPDPRLIEIPVLGGVRIIR